MVRPPPLRHPLLAAFRVVSAYVAGVRGQRSGRGHLPVAGIAQLTLVLWSGPLCRSCTGKQLCWRQALDGRRCDSRRFLLDPESLVRARAASTSTQLQRVLIGENGGAGDLRRFSRTCCCQWTGTYLHCETDDGGHLRGCSTATPRRCSSFGGSRSPLPERRSRVVVNGGSRTSAFESHPARGGSRHPATAGALSRLCAPFRSAAAAEHGRW